jgi:hypothetical protein
MNLKLKELQLASKMAESPQGWIMAGRFAPLDLDEVKHAELRRLPHAKHGTSLEPVVRIIQLEPKAKT